MDCIRIAVFARFSSTFVLFAVVLFATITVVNAQSTAMVGGALPVASAPNVPADFAIKDGDRVLFYGDSITEQRLYTTYVEHYILTHFPERHVTFINTGWGGDSVNRNTCVPCNGVGGIARLKRDVLDHKPTVVTLLFGMNDGDYRDFDPATMKVFVDGLKEIIHGIKAGSRARIYVMTPTVYDGTRHTSWSHTDKYNDVLDRYSEAAKQLAAAENLPVIDLHSVTTRTLLAAKAADPSYTFLDDGVHPQPDGQLVMATEILKSWGAETNGVEVQKALHPDQAGNATVDVQAPLPWPVPVPSAKLNSVNAAIMDLGRLDLKLSGLTAGSYSMSINGASAGTFTSEQLATGIDLNTVDATAIAASTKLVTLIRQRADLFMLRWRQIEVPFSENYAHGPAAVSSLDALINDMSVREREMAGLHTYKIVISRQ